MGLLKSTISKGFVCKCGHPMVDHSRGVICLAKHCNCSWFVLNDALPQPPKIIEPKLFQDVRVIDYSGVLNRDFYNVNKESLLKAKPIEKRLSSNYIDYDSIKDEDEFLDKAVSFITRTAYGLYTFITGDKNPKLSIHFGSESNFNLITFEIKIGCEILFHQHIPRQTRVDIIVGIVYHEFYHRKYTMQSVQELFLESNSDTTTIIKYYGYIESFIKCEVLTSKLLTDIINILEDRRIEQLGHIDFPGYVFNFNEIRNYGLHIMAGTEFKYIDKHNLPFLFLVRKVLLPESLPMFFDELKSLDLKDPEKSEINKTIQEIENYISENDGVLSLSFKDIFFHSKEIYQILSRIMNPDKQSNYNNLVTEFDAEELYVSKDTKQRLLGIVGEIAKEEEVVEGKFEEIKDSENASYQSLTIFDGKVEQNLVELQKAKVLSKPIFQQLGFLNSKFSRNIENFELSEGDLDETELHSINYNSNIFENVESVPQYSLDFGILLDESGSMQNLITDARIATLALALSLEKIKNINLFVYGHTSNEDLAEKGASCNSIHLYKYINSLENFKDVKRILSAKARANNVDGYAIQKIGEIMNKSKSREKVLIVVSDGMPNGINYTGKEAIAHTKGEIEKLEAQGFYVIQICMANIKSSGEMFTNYIPFENNSSFFNNLKKVLMKKLNQFSQSI